MKNGDNQEPVPPPSNLLHGRLILTGFFLGVLLLTLLFTYGIADQIDKLRVDAGESVPQWKVMGIPTGDRLLLVKNGQTNRVSIAGIASPPPMQGEALKQSAFFLNLTEVETKSRGIVARDTLRIWLNRRLASLEVISAEGTSPTIAYVYVGGIDVGNQMIMHGQAYQTELDHPRGGAYTILESQAKSRKIGIWRD